MGAPVAVCFVAAACLFSVCDILEGLRHGLKLMSISIFLRSFKGRLLHLNFGFPTPLPSLVILQEPEEDRAYMKTYMHICVWLPAVKHHCSDIFEQQV